MPRVIGIDPGTISFDVCGLDDGRPFLATAISSVHARDPREVVARLCEAGGLDLIAAPSGYGLPLVPLREITDQQIDLLLLVRPEDRNDPELVGALRPTIQLMRENHLPAVFLPGVVHLATVPVHRKVNRVDLGTADKVCVAALAIWEQARRLGVPPTETSFILVELGGAFSAAIAVDRGRIIDGIGGASGGLGYRALGTLDGEIAYALGRVSKSVLFTGGAAFVSGEPDLAPERWPERAASGGASHTAWLAFLESVEKMVASLRVTHPEPREVILSGRVSRVCAVADALADRLGHVAPLSSLSGFTTGCKEGAQGAALLADGLAGGSNAALVDALELRASQGTVLDHLHVRGSDRVRRDFGVQ